VLFCHENWMQERHLKVEMSLGFLVVKVPFVNPKEMKSEACWLFGTPREVFGPPNHH